MDNIDKNFLESLSRSFKAYNRKGGARSNKKLIPVHKFLSETIIKRVGSKYKIKSLGMYDGKEGVFEGKYYPKNLDIAVYENERLLATISFKFITSNYKQNANNYFENLMGETANIRRTGVGFAHLVVLRGHTPYYSKNKGNLRGKKQKEEVISDKDIRKYINLFNDVDFPHKPDLIGFCLVDFDKNKKAYLIDLKNFNFSDETKRLLNKEFSVSRFLEKFIYLLKLKSR